MTSPTYAPNTLDRTRLLASLNDTSWDVVVIGGGATGLGTAVDAASRGFRTLLVEAADFAKGTSSRATKLVHGGVRYLAQGNISLVREALHERGLLHRNAPHLSWPLGFVVPAYKFVEQPFYGMGLKLYDLLAGKLTLKPSRWLSRDQTLAHAPTLALQQNGQPLRGGILYYDGQFDDARLAVTLMRTLQDLGGTAINYVKAVGLTRAEGRIHGVELEDALDSVHLGAVKAQCVINATGVWVDAVRRMDEPHAAGIVAPSQGVHLTLPRDFLPGDDAILIPKTDDGRVLFVVPWNGHTLVGTTDAPRADLPLEPKASEADVNFILQTAARYLSCAPTRADVMSIWAGLRPLVKRTDGATKTLSREHTILVATSGLVTVTGGKWTTYRRMAQDTLDTAIENRLLPAAACRTESLPLHGAPTNLDYSPTAPAGTPDSYYGADLPILRALPGIDAMLVAGSGLTQAHVRYAARFELARTVEDVLARRNRALFLDARAALAAAPAVARILAEELGKDEAWQASTISNFEAVAQGYLPVL